MVEGATLPEVLIAAAEFGATQGDDGVSSGFAPMHTRTFEASTNDDLASGFDHAGRSA